MPPKPTKSDKRESKIRFGMWLGTPEQFRKPKTQLELASEIGTTEVSLSRWRNDPLVQEIKQCAMKRMADGSMWEIVEQQVQKAKEGNTQAARFIADITGELKKPDRPTGIGKIQVEFITKNGK